MLRPVDLTDAVHGDLEAFERVREQPLEILQASRAALPGLIVTPWSVRRVLVALRRHEAAPERVQEWASFIRRGYLAGANGSPVTPIDIEYDAAAEQEIADIVSRLDELGDAIDGEIDDDEIRELLSRLPV